MNTVKENTINGLSSDGDVESRARALFRSACENTDSYHALCLGLARRKATGTGAVHSAARIWAPLAGTVACCAIVAGIFLWMRPIAQTAPTAGVVVSSEPVASGPSAEDEDADLELGTGQVEMVQDLGFYRWLASQPAPAPTRNRGAR